MDILPVVVEAGVVAEGTVVGQRDILLLPLLVQRAATPLPEDTLFDGGGQPTGQVTLGVSSSLLRIAATAVLGAVHVIVR